jgi:hypothetical protein
MTHTIDFTTRKDIITINDMVFVLISSRAHVISGSGGESAYSFKAYDAEELAGESLSDKRLGSQITSRSAIISNVWERDGWRDLHTGAASTDDDTAQKETIAKIYAQALIYSCLGAKPSAEAIKSAEEWDFSGDETLFKSTTEVILDSFYPDLTPLAY